jgi:uncharacterized membrane protein
MTGRQILFVTLGFLLVVYTAFVLVRIVRASGLSRGQKWAQAAIVVFLPLAGPLFVHAFHRTDRQEPAQTDKNFERQDIGAL